MKIRESFLRGCGVPDAIIKMIPALIGAVEPIQFYSCFISYNQNDDDFANRLQRRVQQENLRVWFAPEEMKAGQKIHEQIDSAIRIHDKLLLVISETSMRSNWVAAGIRKAKKRERLEGKQVLFPIRLVPFERLQEWELFDAESGIDVAAEIREYFIPDFSNWKDITGH